jgi:hypothetical protein
LERKIRYVLPIFLLNKRIRQNLKCCVGLVALCKVPRSLPQGCGAGFWGASWALSNHQKPRLTLEDRRSIGNHDYRNYSTQHDYWQQTRYPFQQ